MRLADTYRNLVTEKKKSNAVKYDMQNINGGFSNGVEIKPGSHAGVMDISVNIYGGNQKTAHPHQVPQSIQQLQEAYIAARKTGDPVASDIKIELEAYYTNLRKAISLEVIRLMQQFDTQAKESIAATVARINQRYQE